MRIPRSSRDLQVERESQFSDSSSQRLFHGPDLFFGQRRQQLSICAVVSDTMSYDHEGQGSVHVLVDDHLASSQGRTPIGPLELHDQVAKAHGVISIEGALVTLCEDYLEVPVAAGYECRAPLCRRNGKPPVELCDVVLVEELFAPSRVRIRRNRSS